MKVLVFTRTNYLENLMIIRPENDLILSHFFFFFMTKVAKHGGGREEMEDMNDKAIHLTCYQMQSYYLSPSYYLNCDRVS